MAASQFLAFQERFSPYWWFYININGLAGVINKPSHDMILTLPPLCANLQPLDQFCAYWAKVLSHLRGGAECWARNLLCTATIWFGSVGMEAAWMFATKQRAATEMDVKKRIISCVKKEVGDLLKCKVKKCVPLYNSFLLLIALPLLISLICFFVLSLEQDFRRKNPFLHIQSLTLPTGVKRNLWSEDHPTVICIMFPSHPFGYKDHP